MKRIVRGNDFYLSIPVQKVVGGERSDFDLTGSEGIVVEAANKAADRVVNMGITMKRNRLTVTI